MWEQHLPNVARMAAHHLDDPARVTDGAVRQQEEQPGVSTDRGLPQDPGDGGEDVGPPHVGSHLPDVVARRGHGLLEDEELLRC